MARLLLTLTVETDLVLDAIADIERIFCALAKRHGQRFRDLERRIERLMDLDANWGVPQSHSIGDGRFIFEPHPELKGIIREAREIGVI